MKNLNPVSGYRQIANGYFCIPRKIILELCRNKEIKPSELGSFIVFLASADWDNDRYRKGYIRHNFSELSKIWNIPQTTLYDYAKVLRNKNLLTKENNTYKIIEYDNFTYKGAQLYVKNNVPNENLDEVSSNPQNISEIPKNNKANNHFSFRDSFKVNFIDSKLESNIKKHKRTIKEYEEIYQEGNYHYLTPEDMQWIDNNITEDIPNGGNNNYNVL